MKDLINDPRTADIREDKGTKGWDKTTQEWLKMKNE